MKLNIKPGRLVFIIVIAGIIIFVVFSAMRIMNKIKMTSGRGTGAIYNVGVMPLKKENVKMVVSIQGTVTGDPQILVYPNMGGKFIRNVVPEGKFVVKDQALCYIDPSTPGSYFVPEPVLSPINGMVIRYYFMDRGANITVNNAVAEIGNPLKIKVEIEAGEDELLKVAVKQEADIISIVDNSRKLTGVVDSTTPFIDTNSQTGLITVKADNPDDILKIGMTVEVIINTGSKMAFMVPHEALVMGIDRTTVFLAVNDKAKQIEIKTGYYDAVTGLTEIISDQLKDGDVLINVGSFKLFDGASIKIGSDKG